MSVPTTIFLNVCYDKMGSIEDELWNIFTFYSLHGNPRDPSRINGSVLYRFCRDVLVLDASMTERPISQAELHLLYAAELKSPSKVLRY